jgi:hypothetical protein
VTRYSFDGVSDNQPEWRWDYLLVQPQKFSIAGALPSFSRYSGEMNYALFLQFCALNIVVDFVTAHLELLP